MASAVPNAWAWFGARVGHGAGAESARSPHDVADRRRRRAAPLASVSLGGAPDLVAELASVRAFPRTRASPRPDPSSRALGR